MLSASRVHPAPLRIGVVGAGRVGAVLGRAWRDAGHDLVAVSAVSQESRERARQLLPGTAVLPVDQVAAQADVVLLAVPDDALSGLVAGLAAAKIWRAGQLVVHTAGRFGVSVMQPAVELGVIPIALHPAMTFAGTIADLPRLAGAVCAVTAPDQAVAMGLALVLDLGAEPVVVQESDRGLYHAALAHAANHLVVMMAQAAQVLSSVGIDEPGRVLGPLSAAALDGAMRSMDAATDPATGAVVALTGPVSRGDVGTVAAHCTELAHWAVRTGATDVIEAYRVLSRSAARRALAGGRIRAGDVGAILDVLDGSEGAGD